MTVGSRVLDKAEKMVGWVVLNKSRKVRRQWLKRKKKKSNHSVPRIKQEKWVGPVSKVREARQK